MSDQRWQEAVPDLALTSQDVRSNTISSDFFVAGATALIEGFEERLTPDEAVLLNYDDAIFVAAKADANPIAVSRRGIQLSLANVHNSEVVARESLPRYSQEAIDTTTLLGRHSSSGALERQLSPEVVAVGAMEITKLVRAQEDPLKLSALVALQAAGLDTGIELSIKARRKGQAALVREVARAAIFGGVDAGFNTYSDEELRAVNAVLGLEKPRAEAGVRRLFRSKDPNEPLSAIGNFERDTVQGASVEGALGWLLDKVFEA